LTDESCSDRERLLDFGKQEQKEEWYVQMMPNGRIPVLQDHWNNGKVVWESNAMLKYIADRYDTERKFLVDDDDLKTDMDTCELLRLLLRT
jgi:glutathione S-transferase